MALLQIMKKSVDLPVGGMDHTAVTCLPSHDLDQQLLLLLEGRLAVLEYCDDRFQAFLPPSAGFLQFRFSHLRQQNSMSIA